MAFWGTEVKPGKPFTHSARERLHISQATLGLGNGSEIEKKKSVVQCNIGNKSPVFLCSLFPEHSETCQLNLEFEEGNDDVIFSVIGPRSVHLTGYYLPATGHHRDDSEETFGEDIAHTDTERSDNDHHNDDEDDDEYDDSFIDDDDEPLGFPPSPLSSGGEAVEALRRRKPKDKKNGRKRLKKKYEFSQSDEDDTSQQHNVANGCNVMALLESESEDILTISSLCKSAVSKKLDEAEENAENELNPKINIEVEDGVNFSTMSIPKADPDGDIEVKRQPDQNESILQSAEVGLENDTKPAKKKKKKSKKDKKRSDMEVDKSSHDIHMEIKEDQRTEIDKQPDQQESLLHSAVEDSKGGANLKKKKKKLSKEDKEHKAGVEDDTVLNLNQSPQSESKADQSTQDITTENEVDQRAANDLGDIALVPYPPSVELVHGLPAKSMIKKEGGAKDERSVGAESLSHGSVYGEDEAQLDDVEGKIIEHNVAFQYEENQKQPDDENSVLPLNPDNFSKPKKKRERSAEDKIIETNNGINANVILKDKPSQDGIESGDLEHDRSLQNEQNESTFNNNAAEQSANEDLSRKKRKKKKTSKTQENSKALNVEESKKSSLPGTGDNNADEKSSQLGTLSSTLLHVDMETEKHDQKVATPKKKVKRNRQETTSLFYDPARHDHNLLIM